MVAQGLPALEQEFELLPVVATYHVAPSSAGMSSPVERRVGFHSFRLLSFDTADAGAVCALVDMCHAVSTWLKCRLMLPRLAFTSTSSRTGRDRSLGVTSMRQTSSAGR